VIENVEEFGSEFDLLPLGDLEVFMHGEINSG